MYQGFYELTSGMLTQQRKLNVIANNMTNVETPGYKSDTQINSTFGEEMLIRTGRTDKSEKYNLGVQTPIVTADQTLTTYTQGTLEETDDIYDVALEGEGFFRIQTPNGIQYTRNGNFSVEDDGTLYLEELGPVLDVNGGEIKLLNENISIDSAGNITDEEGNNIGQISVVNFEDTALLHKEDNGMYTTDQEEQVMAQGSDVVLQQRWLERSNVDMTQEMTNMMSSQRAFQSSAQLLKMYDNLMSKSSEIGRV